MRKVVWGLVLLLAILHQDLWFWEDSTLVGGIVPIGLFFHACLSVAAGLVWWLATIYAWPIDDTEESAGGGEA